MKYLIVMFLMAGCTDSYADQIVSATQQNDANGNPLSYSFNYILTPSTCQFSTTIQALDGDGNLIVPNIETAETQANAQAANYEAVSCLPAPAAVDSVIGNVQLGE